MYNIKPTPLGFHFDIDQQTNRTVNPRRINIGNIWYTLLLKNGLYPVGNLNKKGLLLHTDIYTSSLQYTKRTVISSGYKQSYSPLKIAYYGTI